MAERAVCGAGGLFSSCNWTNSIEPHRCMDVSNSNLSNNCDRCIRRKYSSNLLHNWCVDYNELLITNYVLLFSYGGQQNRQFYSVFTILYRVFTFNDCPEAAEEIQKQIQEAKDDLTAKGLKF